MAKEFSPSNVNDNALAKKIEAAAAELLKLYEQIQFTPSDNVSRFVSLSRTHLEMSVMWSYKALSKE